MFIYKKIIHLHHSQNRQNHTIGCSISELIPYFNKLCFDENVSVAEDFSAIGKTVVLFVLKGRKNGSFYLNNALLEFLRGWNRAVFLNDQQDGFKQNDGLYRMKFN